MRAAELKSIRASLPRGNAREVTRAALVIFVAVMIGSHSPSALADGDPASDVLLVQDAFYPYAPPVTHALEVAMDTVLHSAARAGLPLKVAVIGSPEDLGAVPNLFGHPQQYAEFLDREISYNHQQSLLVVMPAGFGVVAAGAPTALAKVKVDATHSTHGLVRSAVLAVVSLVRATGRKIALPSIPSSTPAGGGPPAILFAVPAALLVLAGVALLRRREPRRQDQTDTSNENS